MGDVTVICEVSRLIVQMRKMVLPREIEDSHLAGGLGLSTGGLLADSGSDVRRQDKRVSN